MALANLCFFSCEKEKVEIEKTKDSWNATSQKISLNDVSNELNNATIKEFLVGLETQNYLKNQNEVFFEKIIRENKYNTYTLALNKFSVSEPFFKFFVIKKVGDKETAGIVKYSQTRLSPILNVNHFTGVIELFDIYGNRNAVSSFQNSVFVSIQNNVNSKTCTNNIRIVRHSCSNGGGHGVGESCGNGYTNDAYYEIIISQTCTTTEPAHVAGPDEFMGGVGGGGSGGSGTSNTTPEDLALTEFLNDLTLEENNFLFSHMDMINYLLANNVSEESKNFVLQVMNEIRNRPIIPLANNINLVRGHVAFQINDMIDYLKCFDPTQPAVFTLLVDQPTANSNSPWSGNPVSPDVGHTFISIKQGSIRRVLGFYPSTAVGLNDPSTVGTCENDSGHPFDVSLSLNINPTQLVNVLNYIKTKSSNTYNLNTYNCTDFGMAATSLVGIAIPSAYGTWGVPGVGSGSGDNPGQLGQNIRNLPVATGIVKTTNTGTAPVNIGTCP